MIHNRDILFSLNRDVRATRENIFQHHQWMRASDRVVAKNRTIIIGRTRINAGEIVFMNRGGFERGR